MIAFENDRRTTAERMVLASILQDNHTLRHVRWLAPAHFSHDLHGQVYRHMRALEGAGESITVRSVYESMNRRRHRAHAGLMPYLIDLFELHPRRNLTGFCALSLMRDFERHDDADDDGDAE